MHSKTENDKKKLFLMKELINDYKKSIVHLEEIPYKIESLIQSLEEISSIDKQSLFNEWATLEEIYAFMMFKERTYLLPQEKIIFNKAIENIEKKIKELM